MKKDSSSKKIPDKVAFPKIKPGQRSHEDLSHFWCKLCNKWWSIGDAPVDKTDWYCPWCGVKAIFK